MKLKPPKMSIIIPTYNGQKLLADCLASLKKQTMKNFEVVVVDNGSSDGTVDFMKNDYPKARVVKLKSPAGFARPVNCGIRAARGKYIALINNDVILDKNWVKAVLCAFAENRRVDFIACLMLTKDGEKVDSAGVGFSWWGRGFPIGAGDNPKKYQKSRFVFGTCGGAAVFRREVFRQIGLLDEDFYAYFEDVDLSFRAQLAGLRCLYLPAAIVYHLGSASFKKDTLKMRYIGNRNKDWVVLKNYPINQLILRLPQLAIVKIKSLATDFWQGLLFSQLAADITLLASLPWIILKRRKIQKQRRVSSEYLNSIIENGHPRLK